MPRQPRLDAPGTLHHVIGRGIEGSKIFRTRGDREDLLGRLAKLCEAKALSVYAWALLDTHFHLLVRSGNQSLSHSMRRLLTGYVVNFNRRHKRYGHLFQNRYKSILCEEDPYLLELTRYIHLNPLRAGVVKNLKGLRFYAWSGHSTVMGKQKRGWQDVGEEQEVRGGDQRRSIVGARKVFSQMAVKRLGYSGASVARFLGVTTSLVNRYARSEDVGNLGQYI
jgi:putative transposase